MPVQNFGSVTMVVPSPVSQVLAFGTEVFGTFTSTSITEPINNPGFVNIVADGLWSPGTYATEVMGVTGGPFEAELRFAFTQTPVSSGAISASATFGVVPEPSTIVMGLIGLAGVVIYRLRQRRRHLSEA